jgi:hypothetical protein
MREMGSAVGEQRQRLLMSRTASFGARSVGVAASVHKQSSLEYPAGVATAILTVSASGYLSGCLFIDIAVRLHKTSSSTTSGWRYACLHVRRLAERQWWFQLIFWGLVTLSLVLLLLVNQVDAGSIPPGPATGE